MIAEWDLEEEKSSECEVEIRLAVWHAIMQVESEWKRLEAATWCVGFSFTNDFMATSTSTIQKRQCVIFWCAVGVVGGEEGVKRLSVVRVREDGRRTTGSAPGRGSLDNQGGSHRHSLPPLPPRSHWIRSHWRPWQCFPQMVHASVLMQTAIPSWSFVWLLLWWTL